MHEKNLCDLDLGRVLKHVINVLSLTEKNGKLDFIKMENKFVLPKRVLRE